MSTKKVFILWIIIAFGIAFLLQRNTNENAQPDDSSGLIVASNAIYAAEQAPGRSVLVSLVRFEKPGFVVIHDDVAGSPGKILGVSGLLKKGETKNLSPITLSKIIINGETIYAMLHFDDSDGVFNAAKDKPVLFNFEPTMMIITVSSDTTVEPGAISL
ncbi:MAG: hypothetical protein AAB522_01340 [Patescibacteria group bacterium]